MVKPTVFQTTDTMIAPSARTGSPNQTTGCWITPTDISKALKMPTRSFSSQTHSRLDVLRPITTGKKNAVRKTPRYRRGRLTSNASKKARKKIIGVINKVYLVVNHRLL